MTQPKIALVTGASRGAGAGVARGLGEQGYTVYVTGRSVTGSTAKAWDGSPLPGTIGETAAEITKRGGQGIGQALEAGRTAREIQRPDVGRLHAGHLHGVERALLEGNCIASNLSEISLKFC